MKEKVFQQPYNSNFPYSVYMAAVWLTRTHPNLKGFICPTYIVVECAVVEVSVKFGLWCSNTHQYHSLLATL